MQTSSSFYRASVPAPPLRSFIGSFWLYEGYRPDHPTERVLPTGTLELVIPLSGQRLFWSEPVGHTGSCAGPLLCGPRRTAFDVPTDQQSRLAGVHFHPGGAWPLFGVPMDALAERNQPLDELWGRPANELMEALREAVDAATRWSILNAFFLGRLPTNRAGHRAVRAAVAPLRPEQEVGTVSRVVAASGLSHRRFIELFRREVGLTPRDYGRVRRFQRALSLSRRQATSGADLAAHAGYFDQSHWLLECKKLAGMSPSALTASHRGSPLPEAEKGQMLPIRSA